IGVFRKLLREFNLQDRFIGGRRRKKVALHAIEGTRIFGRLRHSRDYSRERLIVEAHFREETDLRIDFHYIRELLNFFAGVFIKYADTFAGLLLFTLRPARSAKTVLGRHQNGVEQPTLRKPLGSELLKAYAKRKHRHER